MNTAFAVLSVIAIAGGGSSSDAQSTASQSSVKQSSAKPSTVKLYGQVNELLSACANAGVEITSTTLPARIQKVRLGSPAFYGGLQDNDLILKGSLDNNRLQLTIRRGPALYGINLATQAGSGSPATSLQTATSATTLPAGSGATPVQTGTSASTLKTGSPSTTLSSGTETQATTKDPAWKKLKNYDIVMLIDQSGSMNDAVDSNGQSKWDWCGSQLTTFASQALENTGRHFTIVTFNGNYDLRRNCDPRDVQQTFTKNRPGGATDLATPLDFVLKDYMGGARINPLLVVVLTDGMPAAPEFVEKSIVDITQRMSSPDQIKIVLFEIGNDSDGRALIRLLDAGLVSQGARYDIVDANTFERLQQVGLKLALYDTFNHNFQTSLRVSPSQNLQSELEAVRKQLREARARNALNPSTR